MFSQGKIDGHVKVIQSACRFMKPGDDMVSMVMSGVHRDECIGAAIHLRGGQDADWTCYFVNQDCDWVFAVLHPLALKEMFPLYYGDQFHDACCNREESARAVLMAFIIGDEFVAARLVCPEFMAFALTRFSSRNIFPYDELSEIWAEDDKKLEHYTEIFRKYANKEKRPLIVSLGKEKKE